MVKYIDVLNNIFMKKIIVLILLVMLFFLKSSYCQNFSDSIVFLAKDFNNSLGYRNINDQLVLYKDSTFKYLMERNLRGLYWKTTSGVYSVINDTIYLNSYDWYRTKIEVKDSLRKTSNILYYITEYLDLTDSYLIEIDDKNNELKDTLFFTTRTNTGYIIHNPIESNKKNIIGFKFIQYNLCREYYFQNKESNVFYIDIIYPIRYEETLDFEKKILIPLDEKWNKIRFYNDNYSIIFREANYYLNFYY